MARSMAMTRASGTFSMAMNSTSGFRRAVSTVNRPLPQPSSSRTSRAWGISSSRHRPFRAKPSRTWTGAHFSILGPRFFFFRIRMTGYLLKISQEIIPYGN